MTTTITITLPETLGEFIASEVSEGRYATAEEFIQQALLEVQRRKTHAKIEGLLHEGLNSGPPIPVTPAYWEERERRLIERFPEAKDE